MNLFFLCSMTRHASLQLSSQLISLGCLESELNDTGVAKVSLGSADHEIPVVNIYRSL